MSTWTRKRTLIAGIALIALTNAIALTGVAYNRSGPPEAVLKLPREVLLVLEFDGEAYQEALRSTREYSAQQEALRTANPGKKEFEDRARHGDELVKQEVHDNSRLFVIDAGLDAAALRAKYPDSSKYAIARGRVVPSLGWESKSPELTGVVSELNISEVNVPSSLRGYFTSPQHQYAPSSASPYEVTLAIGKRLEPWIMGVTPTAVQ